MGSFMGVHVIGDGKLYTEDCAHLPVYKDSTVLDIVTYLASAVVDIDN